MDFERHGDGAGGFSARLFHSSHRLKENSENRVLGFRIPGPRPHDRRTKTIPRSLALLMNRRSWGAGGRQKDLVALVPLNQEDSVTYLSSATGS